MAARRSRARTGRAVRNPARESRVAGKTEAGFPVVAVGASAGGIEAFRHLLPALPANSGMAFILVLHLDPKHASRMAQLLTASTAMQVVEARKSMPLEPDHVYVIPPGCFLSVGNGALDVSPPTSGRVHTDAVRRPSASLAKELGERAVCIVLTGTGSDGSAGVDAIKKAGGLVIAQDPDDAEYDGMPRSAIATGAVDLVLPLAKIPHALAERAGHRYVGPRKARVLHPAVGEGIVKILDLVREKTSHDFAPYKAGTLVRRIERRMSLAGVQDVDSYLRRLKKDSAELQHLADDLLINVTCFFRDGKAFELLKEKVVSEFVRAQPPAEPIRIWVVGCSTGEEAYSIALLFLEEIGEAQRNVTLQIFATDIDADAIEFAREGLYPTSIEAHVPPARLSRFFVKEERGYRVSRELRASIIFSVHDVTSDAPFSRLDLISCRNLLIYLRPEAQAKVVSVFHFALREGGALFLGSSETVGAAGDHFKPISKKHHIYRHIGHSRPGEVALPFNRGEGLRLPWPRPGKPAGTRSTTFTELVQRLLLENYGPASVLVNRKHQGLYYFGPTDRYLKMPSGIASLDLLASAREGLRPAIRTALEKANGGQPQAVTIEARIKRNGSAVAVTVSARPVKTDGEELVLLSFLDLPKKIPKAAGVKRPADGSRIVQLEQELDAARKELENEIHDRKVAEDELRVINEDAMAVNEEFQATNEELETSKEELQSLNEELMALNSQLQDTADRYQVVANDLENILNSTLVATLFLDSKLNIRFFTPAAKALFRVLESDIGRPLADLTHRFADGSLFDDARTVLSNLASIAREVKGENGAWFVCRIVPYRTKDNRVEGVVITFVDITERKRWEETSIAAKLQAEAANLGKSRFLAAASHDLRQPLQTLTFLQGLLAAKLKDNELLQLVALSEEALSAMSGMLNTLLDINQLEAGVIRPSIASFRINQVLERVKREFSYHTQAHELGWRVLPCRLAVRSDPRLLEEMVRNLLSNAVKYTKKGRILLGCRRHGERLRIEVWDTGLGIPEAQLRAIFQEFHQIENPIGERSKGLGLGLAIVQRLGDLLGHPVDVRSRVGHGSVFSIELPLAPDGKPLAPEQPEPKNVSTRAGRILIVEDDPALRDSLDALLRIDGHRTSTAADGDEALELVARKDAQPDLAIVDYDLPSGQTGLQVIARLRETLGRPLPALILTGDISTETLSDIDRQGYLHRSKPITADDLTRLVRAMLSGSAE
jgi:two-component system CheB/CheR fusion protein